MNPGYLVDGFIVGADFRPAKEGYSFLEARFEGTYSECFLSIVPQSLYPPASSPEALMDKIRRSFVIYSSARQSNGLHDCGVLLPGYTAIVDSIPGHEAGMLGSFSKEDYEIFQRSVTWPLGLEELQYIALFLARLHSCNTGCGALHPFGMSLVGNMLWLACPLFPAFRRQEEGEWVSGLAGDAITADRRAFALMMLDHVNNNSDAATFSKRLDHLTEQARSIPEIAQFLKHKNQSCDFLVEAVRNRKFAQEARKLERQRRRRLITRGAIAASVLLCLAGAYAGLVHWCLSRAAHAQEQRNWLECARYAQYAEIIYPLGNKGATLANMARQQIKAADGLRKNAERSKSSMQWEECLQAASAACEIDPYDRDAAMLRKEASEKVDYMRAELQTARISKANGLWRKCLQASDNVLGVRPAHAEAQLLRDEAWRNVSAEEWYAEAVKARDAGNWNLCETRYEWVVQADPSFRGADELRRSIELRRKQEQLLALAKEAEQSKKWHDCYRLVDDAMQIGYSLNEAADLRMVASNEVLWVDRAISAADMARKSGRWSDCLTLANQILEHEPGNEVAQNIRRVASRAVAVMTYLGDAKSALREGRLTDGAQLVEKSLDLDPNNAEGLSLRQVFARKIKVADLLVNSAAARSGWLWTECLTQAEAALALEPDSAAALELKKEARSALNAIKDLLMQANLAKHTDNWEQCETLSKKALIYDPNCEAAKTLQEEASRKLSIVKKLGLADKAYREKRWTAGIDISSEVLQLDPENKEALYLKVASILNMARTDKFFPASHYMPWLNYTACAGDPWAQFAIGEILRCGYGVEVNEPESIRWYEKAARQKHAPAVLQLGICYWNGQGVEKSDAMARQWFETGAEDGNAECIYGLACCYRDGRGVGKKDLSKALELYLLSANKGCGYAQHEVGWLYETGSAGIPKDKLKALEWYRKASAGGITKSDACIRRLEDAGGE